jgi:hypothetical protein
MTVEDVCRPLGKNRSFTANVFTRLRDARLLEAEARMENLPNGVYGDRLWWRISKRGVAAIQEARDGFIVEDDAEWIGERALLQRWESRRVRQVMGGSDEEPLGVGEEVVRSWARRGGRHFVRQSFIGQHEAKRPNSWHGISFRCRTVAGDALESEFD